MSLKASHLLFCLAALSILPSAAQAQMFFEADFVALSLDDGSNQNLITGPDPFTAAVNSSFEPGFRLTLGGEFGNYEVYSTYTQTSPWTSSGQRTLANALVLDDNFASGFVAPANVLAFNNALFDAATVANAAPNLDETSEIEYLQAGAVARFQSRTTYSDFELNLGTSRSVSPWRGAIGYRNIRINGDSSFAVTGTFDAIDVGTGASPGDIGNLENDGLAASSFLAAGFTQTAGGGFDALDPAVGNTDTMTILSSVSAHNEMNGAQATLAYRALSGEWLQLEAIGKAGIYNNRIRGQVSEVIAGSDDADGVFTRTFSNRRRSPAFVGSIGGRAIVSLTDYINLVGGYEVMFLTGVGVNGDQTAALSRDFLGNIAYDIATGDMILHGANVGLELLW